MVRYEGPLSGKVVLGCLGLGLIAAIFAAGSFLGLSREQMSPILFVIAVLWVFAERRRGG